MKKIIKRSISLLIILSLILSVLPVEFLGERSNVLAATSEGEKFTVNGLNYVILSDNTSVGVTGATDSSITELVIPETVNYDNYDFHVTEIRYQAFQYYTRLTKISMGNNVEVINDYGFSGCKNLTDVKLSNSLYDAGYKAFQNCIRLENITLPVSLTGNASEMFSGCKSLKTVEFAEGATKIPNGLFENGSITSFVCPDSIVEIGKYAFENCSNLKEVKFSDKLEIIGERAFYNCDKIQKIELPKSLKEMRNGYNGGVFSNCSGLKKINIPKSLKEGNLAFEGCSLLNEIEWEDGITKIPDGLFKNCAGLENVKIPDTVTEIGRYAFENCDNLEDVVLSEKMGILDEGAFYDCDKIQEIELPNSLKEMKNGYANGVFSDCSSLKRLVYQNH
ncbi:MAG: leucine-rich repeat domain-containing protein [Clostridium sp.]